jgi:hypothetical protein
MAPRAEGNGNGQWRTWLLGVGATLIATLITSGILFQRETREQLAVHSQQLKSFETRSRDTIAREFGRHEEVIQRLERRIEQLEKR